VDVPVFETVDDLHWQGPRPEFEKLCQRFKAADLFRRIKSARSS